MLGRSKVLLLLLAVAAVPAARAAAVDEATGTLVFWRSLLQAEAGPGDGPKTAVIANINTKGERVFCVNVTKPFIETTYGASGKETPSGNDVTALAQQICSNPDAAGRQLFTLIRAGGNDAKKATQAVKQAKCSDPNRVPNAVTVASVAAQDTLGSLDAVRNYFTNFVQALQAVGIPACVTLVESDDAGQKVANERYYTTA